MSELIQARQTDIRKKLLVSVSSLALAAYIGAGDAAQAEDAGRPTVWIELGGQMESLQGTSSPFIAPFMTVSPTPAPYQGDALIADQHAPSHAFGLDGKVVFQPENSDWKFSLGVRYGRSNTNRHFHHQSAAVTYTRAASGLPPRTLYAAAYADEKAKYSESHAILDFAVGKDVGLGMFGRDGSSTINVGVRFAQFSNRSTITANGRPEVNVVPYLYYGRLRPVLSFSDYQMSAHAARSFHGVGPSLSWEASAAILGNSNDGQLDLDWGINASLLFGRQNATTDHTTQATYHPPVQLVSYFNTQLYAPRPHHSTRSRSLVVPNVGGFAGLSVKYPNVKVSFGYRADFFFGAVDAGIDTRQTKDLGFHGPFATISVGLGG